MDYRNLLKEENGFVSERYTLVMERIGNLSTESLVNEPYRDFFLKTAEFIIRMRDIYEKFETLHVSKSNPYAWVKSISPDELEHFNHQLYEDILPENYSFSYGNPAYAVQRLGNQYGQLLSFLYTEVRGMVVYAFEGRKKDMTVAAELFMEIYSYFEAEELPEYKHLQKAIYWYISDYSDMTMETFFMEQMDDRYSFIKDIICNADLTDERYLYLYGEYVSENEKYLARFMNQLTDEEILSMADTFVNGFVRGFKVMRMDLSVKKSVCIRAYMGFERILRASIDKFQAMGLTVHIFRNPVASINKKTVRFGFLGTSPNAQYEYDHRQDQALYIDKALNERRLSVLRFLYEHHKENLACYAGPACLQVFGEEPFVPVIKQEALHLNEKQEGLSLQYASQSARLSSCYMDESNMSYTIIAYPIPEIGPDFESIFRETVKINTLDNDLYTKIQQTIIDVLDQADFVRIKGARGRNCTDISVQLCRLNDPCKETKFENCVADVNIPVGEVFTSPVLKGTNGTINVSSVYLNGFNFLNLSVVLKDGMVVDYSCDNFGEEQENRRYIKENILKNHDTLPLGEFAIGTNTLAYAMAVKYNIIHKLPILIVEKTGPHFALGDTCYSRAEEHAVYNPDGKEIVARENECSALREQDPDQAYFNCHTDITIPYDEIGHISAVMPDGREIPVIENGRFVLSETESLNSAFELTQ